MALTSANANMVLGSRDNSKRMMFGIPAGPSGDDPGLLVLESSTDAAVHSQVFLWADSTGVLRYSTTLPTNEDSNGTVLAGTAATTASRALDNLVVTSINADLLPGTTSTSGLGNATYYWKGTYTDVLYLYSDAYITGASGQMTITGNVVIGANGTGADFTFYGDTSAVYMWWDRNGNTNGSLIFTGATATPSLQFVQTNVTYTAVCASDVLTIDATDHANAKITIGNDTTTNGIDFTYYMHTAGSALNIVAGTDTLSFDDMLVTFQAGSTAVGTFTTAANNLYYDGTSANDLLVIGNTTATDVKFGGNGHASLADKTAHFDASAITLGLLDNCILGFGNTAASPDITMVWNATDLLIDGRAADTVIKIGATNNQNFQVYGATATNYVLFDTDDAALKVTFEHFHLELQDASVLRFGDSDDITITWDATDLLIDGAADNTAIKIGATHNQDVFIYAETATSYVQFNTDDTAGNCVFTNYDLAFANGTTTYTIAHSTHSLLMSATDAATASLIFGTAGTNGLDVTFQSATAGDLVKFDAGAKTWTMTDVDLVLGVNSTNQGKLILWDGGGGNTPAYIQMHSPNGTAAYLFVADDGDLRIHTSAPTATGDGTVVGAQS